MSAIKDDHIKQLSDRLNLSADDRVRLEAGWQEFVRSISLITRTAGPAHARKLLVPFLQEYFDELQRLMENDDD